MHDPTIYYPCIIVHNYKNYYNYFRRTTKAWLE